MGMYLVTGQPGHGKTAYALDKAFQWKKEGRTIYAHGIKDLDYEKAGFIYLEDPSKWEELPDGSVVLLDECYTIFPNRNPGAKVPPHVEATARHRHRGFDFIMVAQQGLQLDPFLRGLYEEHVHIRQTSVFKSKTKLKRWTQYQNNTQVQCNDVEDWIRPKYVFDYYTSTTLVTTRRSMPMWLRWLLVSFGLLVVLGFALKWYFNAKIAQYSADTTPAASVQSGAPAPRRGGGGGVPESRGYNTPTDYAKAHLPRFAMLPWSAPVFDQRATTVDPQLLCMSSLGGEDAQGNMQPPSCTCMTEQGTAYEISQPQCRTLARKGPVYNPYKQHSQQDAAPPAVEPASVSAPAAAASVVVSSGENASVSFPEVPQMPSAM